jgi:hypothetical protein
MRYTLCNFCLAPCALSLKSIFWSFVPCLPTVDYFFHAYPPALPLTAHQRKLSRIKGRIAQSAERLAGYLLTTNCRLPTEFPFTQSSHQTSAAFSAKKRCITLFSSNCEKTKVLTILIEDVKF